MTEVPDQIACPRCGAVLVADRDAKAGETVALVCMEGCSDGGWSWGEFENIKAQVEAAA